jgi:transglutaminase-like putative cysteine protease
MTFERYFKVSSYFTIGAGFVAIAATGKLNWIPVFLFVSALISSWFIDTDRLRERIPVWLLNCLSIVYSLFFAVDAILLSRSFFVAAIHFIFFAAILKLLTLSKNRDYFLLYLISFTELLVAATLTVNLVFAICFLIFLFSGIQTFILFEMRRSNARIQNKISIRPFVAPRDLPRTDTELFSPFPVRLLSATSIGITLLILVVALPLFILLPRIASGFYRQPSGKTQLVSGFSESVELGRIGSIQQSDSVVMRVRTSLPPSRTPVDLKWRGLAFDHYDGRTWKRSNPVPYPVLIQEGYFKLEDTARGPELMRQSFFLEALSTNVVFAAHKALAVSREAGFLTRDSEENLFVRPRIQRKLSYEVISDTSRPNPALISDTAAIPANVEETCLQLPPLDTRIGNLAKQVTTSAESKYEKAKALEHYLRSRYSYSLELTGTPGSADPLAMFLFDTREGHCEYFASAMAIMLRCIGIPSRLVNGFRAGEYNRIGDNWIVRQYHAHSWVETYLPPYGWIEFDPTPVQRIYPGTAFVRFFADLADAFDLWWWERIVNYNSSSQYRAVVSLHSLSDSIINSVENMALHAYEESRKGVAWIVSPQAVSARWNVLYWGIPLIFIMAMTLVRPLRRCILNRIRQVLYRNRPRLYAGSFYSEALEMLSEHGIVRAPGQTPMEFALSLANHPAGAPLIILTRLYNAIRFGPPDAVPRSKKAEDLLQSLGISLSD